MGSGEVVETVFSMNVLVISVVWDGMCYALIAVHTADVASKCEKSKKMVVNSARHVRVVCSVMLRLRFRSPSFAVFMPFYVCVCSV